MDYDARCREQGITFYEVPPPRANYVHARRSGDHVYLSGHGPFVGPTAERRFHGKVGRDLTPTAAREVAEFVAVGCLGTLTNYLGTLNRIRSIVRITGYVNVISDYDEDISSVTDGASDLFVRVFGHDVGSHARMTVGCAATPQQVPFSADAIVQIWPAPNGNSG